MAREVQVLAKRLGFRVGSCVRQVDLAGCRFRTNDRDVVQEIRKFSPPRDLTCQTASEDSNRTGCKEAKSRDRSHKKGLVLCLLPTKNWSNCSMSGESATGPTMVRRFAWICADRWPCTGSRRVSSRRRICSRSWGARRCWCPRVVVPVQLGKFELDLDDGEVRFQVSQILVDGQDAGYLSAGAVVGGVRDRRAWEAV
jgi:hypothetical protein